MKMEDWLKAPNHFAVATRRVYDSDGTFAKRGERGEICDYIPGDGYLVVDFPSTGPTLCCPNEIRPA